MSGTEGVGGPVGGCQQVGVLVDVAHSACARAASHGGARHEARNCRGMGEMPEIIVVSDAVDGISPRGPVQQRSAEKIEDIPQYPEETVELLKLVSQERVQQRSAEKMEDIPQYPEETVELLKLVSQERLQQRTVDAPRPQDKNVLPKRVSERIFEQGGVIKVPETASQDRRLQRTVEQYLGVSADVDKNVLQERFLRGCVIRSTENICSVTLSCGGLDVRLAVQIVCSSHPKQRRRGTNSQGHFVDNKRHAWGSLPMP